MVFRDTIKSNLEKEQTNVCEKCPGRNTSVCMFDGTTKLDHRKWSSLARIVAVLPHLVLSVISLIDSSVFIFSLYFSLPKFFSTSIVQIKTDEHDVLYGKLQSPVVFDKKVNPFPRQI